MKKRLTKPFPYLCVNILTQEAKSPSLSFVWDTTGWETAFTSETAAIEVATGTELLVPNIAASWLSSLLSLSFC